MEDVYHEVYGTTDYLPIAKVSFSQNTALLVECLVLEL